MATPAPGQSPQVSQAREAEIYSSVTNSLGLAFNPVTGDLRNNENGSYGGDEINIIKPGTNYGWSGRSAMADTMNRRSLTSRLAWWDP